MRTAVMGEMKEVSVTTPIIHFFMPLEKTAN